MDENAIKPGQIFFMGVTMMLIGIDVGGTFTDGVLFSNGSVVHSVKKPTDENSLQKTLIDVLDELLACADSAAVKRLVLSTTLVTNLLATGRGERTAIILVPGSGLPYSAYHFNDDTYILKGSIDFRGREIEKTDKTEIEQTIEEIYNKGIKKVAVAGKFSNRNDGHELQIKEIISSKFPDIELCTSNEISGRLNFPRRIATCYYTAMVKREWSNFADEIEKAIRSRIPGCEIDVLKADGGTTNLEGSRLRPCETIFSGPAASTMGAVALSREAGNSVVVDVGGTTSDISLLIEGQPLYASQGASIEGRLTHINSFAVRSVALGGDSPVYEQGGHLIIGAVRKGPAACFGGEAPTVTDAFNVFSDLNLGDSGASVDALNRLAERLNISLNSLCQRVVEQVITELVVNIREMFRLWENEPAYKVWEVLNKRRFVLHRVIGIGAAASPIIPLLARELGVESFLHRLSPVANALGAAVARPTLAVEVHIDTQNRVYNVSPGGHSGRIQQSNLQMEDAKKIARQYLEKIGRERGMDDYASDGQYYLEEQFNVIRGWDRAGKLFDVGIQIKPGFIKEFEGVSQ